MKQFLVMMAVVVLVGCGEKAAPLPAAHTPENEPEIPQTDQAAEAKAVVVNIADPIIEEAARLLAGKDEGELTAEDLEKQDTLLLDGTKITTTGLKELIKFPNLKNLDLSDTQITDEGIKELANLPKLTFLKLGYSKITDANLKEVAKLHNLKVLELRHTQITDEGIKELTELPQLEILDLTNTKITDAGLKILPKLQKLEAVLLEENGQITKAAVGELKKALPPNCTIYWP